jgi:hypothetical protein
VPTITPTSEPTVAPTALPTSLPSAAPSFDTNTKYKCYEGKCYPHKVEGRLTREDCSHFCHPKHGPFSKTGAVPFSLLVSNLTAPHVVSIGHVLVKNAGKGTGKKSAREKLAGKNPF